MMKRLWNSNNQFKAYREDMLDFACQDFSEESYEMHHGMAAQGSRTM